MIAEADGLAVLAVGADGIAQLGEARIGRLVIELRGPLEGSVRLGHEAADRNRAADIAPSTDLAADSDDLGRQARDLQDVLVGLGGQPAHEVELHLPPSRAVGGGDRADEVFLGDLLVDHLAHALTATLRGEGEATATTVARQLIGKVDVEGVHASAGQ